MRQIIIGFGLMILCLLILFRIAEVSFIRGDVKLEIIVAIAAFIFFFVGLYFNYKNEKKEAQPNAPVNLSPGITATPTVIDYESIRKVGLTSREHEVLVKMSAGLSNQEIATALFLSESTIKTHVSNILFKLDAKRRTQAIEVAKRLKIIS